MGTFQNKHVLGAGILAMDITTGKFLLCRRGMKGAYPNTWANFGGTFEEEDGNPKTTAIREFAEETGCNVPYKLSNEPIYINKNNFITFYTYLGLFDYEFPVKINEESLGYGWFDLNNLPDNIMPEVEELFQKKRKELFGFFKKLDNFN